MTATFSTIDDVIRRLTTIVDDAKTDGSRLSYFPALYRRVTAEVRDAIANGVFDDGPRMERLDAFDAYREGGALTRAWKFAFDVTGQWWPIVLQHPLLGINPHINLDLGVAAARVAPGTQLPALREDFNRINGLLASLVGEVQDELARIWTTLRLLNRYLGDVDTAVINFSMERARDQASRIAHLDDDVLALANVVRYPTVVGTVPRIIDILS